MFFPVDEIRYYTYHIYITIIRIEIEYITSEGQHTRTIIGYFLWAYLFFIFCNTQTPLLHNLLQKQHSLDLCLPALWSLVEVIINQDFLECLGFTFISLSCYVENTTILQALPDGLLLVGELARDVLQNLLILHLNII